jgi:hypothetical protein
MTNPVPADSEVSAGTYRRMNCGYELEVGSTEAFAVGPFRRAECWSAIHRAVRRGAGSEKSSAQSFPGRRKGRRAL